MKFQVFLNKFTLYAQVRAITHQAVFNTNAYIMLYELESSPYTTKSAPTPPKNKSPFTPQIVLANGNATPAASLNGSVGFTSEKVYGPELPPNRLTEKTNNNNNNPTGSMSNGTASGGSESVTKTTCHKDVKLKFSPQKNNQGVVNGGGNESTVKSPSKTPNRVTPSVVSSVGTTGDVKSQKETAVATKLVPYETDDSSCSDESNQSAHEVDYQRVRIMIVLKISQN